MKIINIHKEKPEIYKIKVIQNILRKGGVIIYPTDTVYGIGANIFDSNAIKRVFHIKKRSFQKPISICVSQIDDIRHVAYINRKEQKLLKRILPGPYTVLLRKKEHISSILTGGRDKIGIRVPNNKISQAICKEFPITSTSANLSGKKTPQNMEELAVQLGEYVDVIIDAGDYHPNQPSTVLDLTADPPLIIRAGRGYSYLTELINKYYLNSY